jgi:hypothetical protein
MFAAFLAGTVAAGIRREHAEPFMVAEAPSVRRHALPPDFCCSSTGLMRRARSLGRPSARDLRGTQCSTSSACRGSPTALSTIRPPVIQQIVTLCDESLTQSH